MKAVVLAAGKGVRMRPLTEGIPKAMVKLAGRPMLEWQLGAMREAGIKEVALIVGYRKEEIERHFGEEWKGVKITYIVQKKQEGTAHALALAKEFVGDEHFIAAYCDVIVDSELLKRLAVVNEFSPYEAVIVGRKVKDPWRYGVLVLENGKVIDLVEKPAYGEEPSDIINAGIYQFSPAIFAAIEKTPTSQRGEYELTDSVTVLMKEGKVGLFGMCTGLCLDIGDHEDLKEAEEKMKRG